MNQRAGAFIVYFGVDAKEHKRLAEAMLEICQNQLTDLKAWAEKEIKKCDEAPVVIWGRLELKLDERSWTYDQTDKYRPYQ